VTDADTIRQAIHSKRYPEALAALDRLVAERDEYHNLLEAEHMRAEAAEAEVAIEREHNPSRVICPKCQANLPCESCKRYSVLRDELEARAEAAEAERDKARQQLYEDNHATKVRERIVAAEAERDEALDRWRNQSDLSDKWAARVEIAEARVAELEAALEKIAWMSVVMPDGSVNTTASYAARAALCAAQPVGTVKDGVLRWEDELGVKHSGPFAPGEDV
jgi:hypothetical protein